VKRKNGITQKDAYDLVKDLRSAKDVDFKWLESDICGSIDSLRSKYPKHEDMIRNLKFRVPKSAFRWLASLTSEEQAKLRIATNRTLDRIFAQSEEWTRYQSGGSLISDTILAYPASCERIPGQIETISDHTRSIIDAKDFKGESGIGLAFEDFEIDFDKDKKGNDVMLYRPKGRIEIIRDFPQMSGWHLISGDADRVYARSIPGASASQVDSRSGDEPSFLGEAGSKRYIKRAAEAWVGRIIRTYSNTLLFDWLNMSGSTVRLTLYACHVSKDKFGLLVQLPLVAEEKKEEERGPKQIKLDYSPKQQPAKKKFSDDTMRLLKSVVAKRTLFYIQNPDRLGVDIEPEIEVGQVLANIAKGEKELQDKLRDNVRGLMGWIFLQNCRDHTVMQFAETFWKVSDALGIPNLFDNKEKK